MCAAACIVVVTTYTRIIKSMVTGQGAVTLELRNTPGKIYIDSCVHFLGVKAADTRLSTRGARV